ncbi:alpha/beta hydrolase fold domain-containing protein [Ditylenchus destructor]|uniref:Alpha/beta hydrolase fold domain-containing protein n=1 Tax=Ditylenchus destructor TaxID=166010 RepID=A0AAD4QZU6_9BILA|nr:alpha/beta hydrolase fold domain-containing protein [Ditylenchus destructor]
MFALLVSSRQLYGDFLVDLIAHLLYPDGLPSSADFAPLKVGGRPTTPSSVGGINRLEGQQEQIFVEVGSWLSLVSSMTVGVFLVVVALLLLLLSALHIPLPTEICDRKKIQVFEFCLRLGNEYLGDIVEWLFGAVFRNKLTRLLVALPYVFQRRPPKWCVIRNEKIAGVDCRVYLPQGERRKTNGAIIFIHGGGWCIMRPSFYDGPVLSLIARVGCTVISIDYTLSPEVPFPTAINECEKVLYEVHDVKYSEYGIDPNRLAVMGDSAGGNLSAVLCQRALRHKRPLIKCQVLIYPVIHFLDMLTPAYRYYYRSYKGTSLLNPKSLIRWYLMYLGMEPSQANIKAIMKNQHISQEIREDPEIAAIIDTNVLPKTMQNALPEDEKLPSFIAPPQKELADHLSKFLSDPDICPIVGKDLGGLAPAMILTCGVDILRDEGIQYARRLRSFGVPVQWNHYEAAFHAFLHRNEMSLWVDKYRPRDLTKLTYHVDQARKLGELISAGDFPHLLFCGPSGAGKRTRIHCLLKKLYGRGAENVRLETQEFQTNSGKKLQIYVVNSNYHIELTPSDVGIQDRLVVQEIIKDMAGVQQINKSAQKSFKVVVLMEAENLTKDAQHALRRTMEKYASTCKIILCCESSSRIIDPLRSRCMVIRVPSPSDKEVKECINYVCSKEGVSLSGNMMEQVLSKAAGNVRRAILLLEGTVKPEWESFLRDTAKIIVQKQSSEGVLEARQRFYEMTCRCIPTSVIFVNLVEHLIKMCDPSIVSKVISAAAQFEHTSKLGSKEIYHLEAFVATFMDLSTNYRNRRMEE